MHPTGSKGTRRGRFAVGQARRWLEATAPFNGFGEGENSFLGDKGWLASLYVLLSAFLHGRPNHIGASGVALETTNGGLWQSNGPIYVSRAFDFWETLFFDTMLLGLLLAALGDYRLRTVERPHDITVEAFLKLLMEWHPSPGPPPVSAVIAEYLFPEGQ